MSGLIETPDFESMEIGKLRQYASHLRVAVPKTATKVEIIELIKSKLNGKVVPEFADNSTQLKPGYARIIIHEDPMPGASNLPVYLNANGYVCTIPRGKEVVVPMRVVRNLNDAKVNRRRQTLVAGPDGRETFKESTVVVPSYPFQVLEMNPGPEVFTALELSKKRLMGPRRRYRAMFGRWPRPRDLTRAIEQKLIVLGEDEMLGASEEALVNNNN